MNAICQFEQLPDGRWQCQACAWITPRELDAAPRKFCLAGQPQRDVGVGDRMHHLLNQYFGTQPIDGCDCPEWIARMNAWGVEGCREHFQDIVDELMDEGRRRKWDLSDLPVRGLAIRTAARLGGDAAEYLFYLGAKWLVRRAIHLAEKEEKERRREGEREPRAPSPEPPVPSP